MANLKKKKKYQGPDQSLVTTPTARDTLTAIQMRNLWRTTGENTDKTFEFVDFGGKAKQILEDTDKKTGNTHNTEQLLKDEYRASRLKEREAAAAAAEAAAAAAEAERLERGSKGSGKPGPYEYKKGGTKKKKMGAKKKKMGGVKDMYKAGGFLSPPPAYNLDED